MDHPGSKYPSTPTLKSIDTLVELVGFLGT